MTDIPELTERDFARMIPMDRLRRLRSGHFTAKDIAALRKYLSLSQRDLAERLGISIDTLQNWEQDRTAPDGPARALIAIIARHPTIITRGELPV